jgi:DNA-binding MarR family transcriptional regulator
VASASRRKEIEDARILLGLLESVERDGTQSQRRLAAELGIALGLVNAYVKRCVKKGLLKVHQAPARRYGYYLTPRGFSEKSRVTVEYLAYSLSFFRRAKADCKTALAAARTLGFERVALAGVSDIAEIATICAIETGIDIGAVVDPRSSLTLFVGIPVVARFDEAARCDGVIVTDTTTPQETYEQAVERFGRERVLAPPLLGVAVAGAVVPGLGEVASMTAFDGPSRVRRGNA